MPRRFSPVIENKHGCLWIVLPDSIDMDSCSAIEARLIPLLEEAGGRVAMDFSKTSAIYSSGLGLVLRMKATIDESGGKLHLVNLSERLVEAFENVGLDQVLPVYRTENDLKTALESSSTD
ncbi:MAG: STAS domain-containing protein [Chitinivibrionales bacterium]|nr:STAS domain-containing protein [Chitinivibrionales bacterium]MBD3357349.1 STAS domain-containing protein [Chitinivibrionales bacterium]